MRYLLLCLVLFGCGGPDYGVAIDPRFTDEQRFILAAATMQWQQATSLPIYVADDAQLAVFRGSGCPGTDELHRRGSYHRDDYSITIYVGCFGETQDMTGTMLHELGHWLELRHQPDGVISVMSSGEWQADCVTQIDAEEACSIHGCEHSPRSLCPVSGM